MRLYRQQTDSSGFAEPRVLARVFPEAGQFEPTVRFYERLTGTALDMHLDARELGIRIAAVGGFLILDLDDTRLDRAEQARRTPVTMIFAHLATPFRPALTSEPSWSPPPRRSRPAAEPGSGTRTACSSSIWSTGPALTTPTRPATSNCLLIFARPVTR